VIADWVSVAALRLGFRPAQRQVEHIVAGATSDFELRLQAALALAWRRVRGAAPALLQLLDDCPDVESCRQVIGALGRLGDRSTASALIPRLKIPMIQRESIRALGQIAAPESLAPLVDSLLHDERSLARMEAARALRSIGGPLAKYSLWRGVLRDSEQVVRDAALMTLADLVSSPEKEGH
jgi:HEAT repeat protein